MNLSRKTIILGVLAIFAIIVVSITNPFGYNDATERTVVTTYSGEQFVKFQPGPYWAGFFAKETEWPNQISISYKEDQADMSLSDNTVEIGRVKIRFNDATMAEASGISQYILPIDENKMIEMHNAHKTPQALVQRRLAPYTQECLQSSAQLLSSEAHYSGGRAQMTQDYLDQLQNGAFLLQITEINTYDSLEKANRKIYKVSIQTDKNGVAKRKFSSIKEYGVSASDAQITDVDYQEAVDNLLAKKIDAAAKASVSKQELMTAQQQQLTAEAQGKKTLVEIEYTQKQEQTKQVVSAQTKVAVAEQDKLQQKIQMEAAELEARKIKTLADARAYEKQRLIQADGALDQKLLAYKEVQGYWADAFSKYVGNVVPTYQSGGGSSRNGAIDFMEIMGAKAARDLNLDLKNK